MPIQALEQLGFTPHNSTTPANAPVKCVLVGCGDYRFPEHVDGFLAKTNRMADRVAKPGAILKLVDPTIENEDTVILMDIAGYIAFHRNEEVLLFSHEDCAAFGQCFQFSTPDDEAYKHCEYLGLAAEKIRDYLQKQGIDLPITMVFFDQSGKPFVKQYLPELAGEPT